MAIDAVLFTADPGSKPVRSAIESDSIQAFAKCKPKELPAVFAMKEQDLGLLGKFTDLVFHRGRKLNAKPLSRLLLGHSKIPLLSGSYKDDGQLIRSIRTLLKNAKEDRNLYIIGVEPSVFFRLWERTRDAGGTIAQNSAESAEFQSAISALDISQMIREEVPASLTQRYVGSSQDAHLVRQLILRAAGTDEAVLILGDSGTGKEIVARCIHDYSRPTRQPFEPVNCGAIPGDLLESVLFGHERYAFTGAEIQRDGLWKNAGSGTLFLDEIGDLRLDHQAKILRALQERKIRPIGRGKEIEVRARVIAATNRDLYSMMKAGQFREDLYWRLRTFMIRTSALRDHPEDIPILASFFWNEITKDSKSKLPPKIISELKSYGWPGNARELKAILSNLHILFGKENLKLQHLRLVFHIGGQNVHPASEHAPKSEIHSHRVECFRHLKRVDETLHACKVAMEPLLERKAPDKEQVDLISTSLRRRLNELELLCSRPLLFHTESTFAVVYRVKGKCAYFLSKLSTDVDQAAHFWRKELADELQLAVSTIFKEVERLLP